ncbi:DEAD/DEAH box RNA helicase [Achlya hypogyna]|uniref:ATP-dependent RNA helicase n=1 Tax=Achlya hypogyna TaxID=1202772 RepID=A0A1V9ZUK4_ACHHY|nr:DEAD/DEAH box RNA helicase [Achlya hypogyna]
MWHQLRRRALRCSFSSFAAIASDVSYASLPLTSATQRAISEVMGYDTMTEVQAKTLPALLAGHDVLAKSKTGSGKTMAFLLPTIETLAAAPRDPAAIHALVLSPTRELATQIGVEAKKLTTFHELRTQCFVGGTSVDADARALAAPIDLLVATPGRLQDHLRSDTGGIVGKLRKARMLILDEADRLLDMGFRADIEAVLAYLPAQRQTILFSATLPASLAAIQKLALKPEHVFIDTVGAEEQTNAHVPQRVTVCRLHEHMHALEAALKGHIHANPNAYKIIVFFPTARAAGFMAAVFAAAKFPVLEMHSRKSQQYRTKTAATFRAGNKLIMFSSDVSARGVDYPDVSFVVQMGLTDREQYIHRLGRTGRAGKMGQGTLILTEFERPLLQELADLPLAPEPFRPRGTAAKTALDRALAKVARDPDLEVKAAQAYQAFLGFYVSNLKRLKLTKTELVDLGEEYAKTAGLKTVPGLQKRTISMMGLQNLGLRVETAAPRRR